MGPVQKMGSAADAVVRELGERTGPPMIGLESRDGFGTTFAEGKVGTRGTALLRALAENEKHHELSPNIQPHDGRARRLGRNS
jgi:hypothetical protein